MQTWAVAYDPASFSDDLYQRALDVVDQESQARIKKFYHRVDSCRTLVGRLLVRVMLKEKGMTPDNMKFGRTAEGKPYITGQTDDPIAYNITHDNNLIAMAFGPGLQNPPAFSIGIDVMKVRIPSRESLESFITAVGDQLTQREHSQLRSTTADSERIRVFFWMWTLKEAYTKALGLGLGFDFKRVEFDVSNRVVRIDGAEPKGWRFKMFTLMDGEDLYEGVVAEYLGGVTQTEVILETEQPSWLKIHSAVTFTENAIETLKAW